MAIVTKYLSETLDPITEDQRLMSDIYHEEIYIYGFLKKRIFHGNSKEADIGLQNIF